MVQYRIVKRLLKLELAMMLMFGAFARDLQSCHQLDGQYATQITAAQEPTRFEADE